MKKIWLIALISIVLGVVSCSEDDDEKTTYIVTFDTNGGSPVPSAQTVEAGNTATAPSTDPVKTGYTFIFWHVNSSATAYNFQTPVKSNITLYAKWQEESTTEYWQVTWNLNGGTWPSDDNHATQVPKAGTLSEPMAPVKIGNTFEGWYKEAALTNKVTFPYDVSNITGNFSLYAKWTTEDTPGGDTPPSTLYIAGTDHLGSCYWKVDLATGSITQIPLTLYGEANDIVLSGSDIYVSGFETSTAGNDKACYWKNGDITFLTLELKKDIAANAIALSGNDIYLAGTEHVGNGTKPCYWKNGARTNLSTSVQWAAATDLFISGNDIYISGWEEGVNGKKGTACYWKNNTKTSLTDGQTTAEAHAIFVLGKDVYTAGRQRKPSTWTACYWKNNSLVTLTDAKNDADILSINASNGKVYAAGYESTGAGTIYAACYWENENQIVLEQATLAKACDIAISGNNVYVAGQIHDDKTDNYIACYWINGVRYNLTDGPGDAIGALAIALSWE